MLLLLSLGWFSYSLIRRVRTTWLRRALWGIAVSLGGLTSWFALSTFIYYMHQAPLDDVEMMRHMTQFALVIPM